MKEINFETLDYASPEYRMEAIDQDPVKALKNISNPTKEEQVYGIRRSAEAIKALKDPCEEAQLETIRACPPYISQIEYPTQKVQSESIEQNPLNITMIRNATEQTKMETLSKRPELIDVMKNPSDKLKEFAKQARIKQEISGHSGIGQAAAGILKNGNGDEPGNHTRDIFGGPKEKANGMGVFEGALSSKLNMAKNAVKNAAGRLPQNGIGKDFNAR